jgi:hypothetical protein
MNCNSNPNLTDARTFGSILVGVGKKAIEAMVGLQAKVIPKQCHAHQKLSLSL